MKKNIIKNTGIVSVGTNLSRLLGLIRDVFIAKFFGTSLEASAFVIAFTIPNLLRDFVGEGATNTVFVPVLTEHKIKDTKARFWQVVSNLFNIMVIALFAVTVIGILLSPLIVRIIAPGYAGDKDAMSLIIRLTIFMFPFILLVGLTAYNMGVLNILNYYGIPSVTSCVLNIVMIVSVFLLCPKMGIYGLAVGVLVGGFLEILMLMPFLWKEGFRFSRQVDFRAPYVKRVGKLMVPRIGGTAVYQINMLADRAFASLHFIVGSGGIPALYFAYRLISYPLGIFSSALSTAILPVMSAQTVENNTEELKKTIYFVIRGIFMLMIPASVGFMILGKPIIKIIYQRGMFTDYSTDITYQALLFFSIGLFAYGTTKILSICFYALKDTITPVRYAAICLVINIILNVILIWPLKVGGIALSTSLSSIVQFIFLYNALQKKLGGLDSAYIFDSAKKIIFSCIPMGVFTYAMSSLFMKNADRLSLLTEIFFIIVIIIAAVVIYFLTTLLFNHEDTKKLTKWLLKR